MLLDSCSIDFAIRPAAVGIADKWSVSDLAPTQVPTWVRLLTLRAEFLSNGEISFRYSDL